MFVLLWMFLVFSAPLEFAVHKFYQDLPVDQVIAEYIWIDGSNNIRGKTKVSA